MIDLSVIIVNYNTRELVVDCVASVQGELDKLSTSLQSEVIVVDNGSTDGSTDALRVEPRQVRVIALDENVGYARGNNVAIAEAKGNVVLLLNTDVIFEEGAIETALEALHDNPTAGAAGIQLVHADGRLQNSIHSFPSLVRELTPKWLLEIVAPKRFPSKRRPPTQPIEVESVLGAALFVKRGVIEAVGPLPEAYFFFLEETDWCLQMRRAGFGVLHVPGARAIHLSGASSKRVDPIATRIEYHRSLYHFLKTNRGGASAAAVKMVRVVKQLLSIVPLALLGTVSPAHRSRRHSAGRLLRWHLAGQPASWGLSQD